MVQKTLFVLIYLLFSYAGKNADRTETFPVPQVYCVYMQAADGACCPGTVFGSADRTSIVADCLYARPGASGSTYPPKYPTGDAPCFSAAAFRKIAKRSYDEPAGTGFYGRASYSDYIHTLGLIRI